MFSVICIYNDENFFKDCLLKSLEKQSVIYDGIFIDNTDNIYNCAAKALNIYANKAIGEYLMFVHQDIIIHQKDWLEKTEITLNKLNNVGIVGVAGCKSDNVEVYTNIRHGISKIYAGKYRISEPIDVQTVDECLFVIPKNVYENIKFDDNTCFDWHLYAVDFCLESKLKGYKVYVIPTEIYHKSSGASISINYYRTIKKLYKKYRYNYSYIRTTCSEWNLRNFYTKYYYLINKFKLKMCLKKYLK